MGKARKPKLELEYHIFILPEIPYFDIASRSCPKRLALEYVDHKLQGTNGPLQLSFGENDAYISFNKAWPKTFQTLKHELRGDPISGVANGAFTNPGIVNPMTKARSHVGSEYLNTEISQRLNLRILTEVLVRRIILKKSLIGGIWAQGV